MFVSSPGQPRPQTTIARNQLQLSNKPFVMDTEGPMSPFAVPSFLQKSAFQSLTPLDRKDTTPFGFDVLSLTPSLSSKSIDAGTGLFGTPWRSSIVANATSDCVFMPFWDWQLRLMQKSLQGFQVLTETSNYLESPSGQHRMVTLTASSEEYRYIRMTYLDGGDKVQIFTSVLYPRGNFPLFGMDLLQLQNGKRNLAICDFQPIHANEEDHDVMYEYLLEPIRKGAPYLQEKMTDRFFDPSRYFSHQTLLGRFQNMVVDPQHVIGNQELWSTYKEYLKTHIQMVQQSTVSSSMSSEQVLAHHRDYDNYVAECDPAHPMFSSIFGPDVAENYVYDVLFPLADKPNKSLKIGVTEDNR